MRDVNRSMRSYTWRLHAPRHRPAPSPLLLMEGCHWPGWLCWQPSTNIPGAAPAPCPQFPTPPDSAKVPYLHDYWRLTGSEGMGEDHGHPTAAAAWLAGA